MKKIVLIAVGVGLSIAVMAQKSQIRTAKNYLGEKEYEKAKTAIEAAINDESTKDDPYAWYVRGTIYLAIQQLPANEGKDIYKEAATSFRKTVALKSDYEKEDMNNKLFAIGIYNFNDGLAAFQKSDYAKSYTHFGEIVDIYSMEGGKRFSSMKKFDTMAHQAGLYQGYSAFYNNQYDNAIPLLEKAKNDPIVKNVDIYLMLADAYEAKGDAAKFAAVLDEAKKEYPGEKKVVNRELNYFIKAGKSDELVKKLEEAIKADPSNVDLQFTLGIAYDNMANPKDKDGKELPKPANYSELFDKAEAAYKTAITTAPDKADVNFNAGALHFNRAVMINDQMNAITGTSAADLKKYDALKAQREEWFNKALPYLEKTIGLLDAQAATLKGEDKNTYMAAIVAAKEIYAKQDKLEKATEMKKKLEVVNK